MEHLTINDLKEMDCVEYMQKTRKRIYFDIENDPTTNLRREYLNLPTELKRAITYQQYELLNDYE